MVLCGFMWFCVYPRVREREYVILCARDLCVCVFSVERKSSPEEGERGG